MVTKDQAINANEFHLNGCTVKHGPHGGKAIKQTRFRRNGKTQVWKTRPDEFRVPIKYGLYGYGEITHDNADQFHVASECPIDE